MNTMHLAPHPLPQALAAPDLGYWISEEDYHRIERACSALMLLESVGEGVGESTALSFDAVASCAHYMREDLLGVLANSIYSRDVGGTHDAH
ncbi:hypothetical protein [Stenotrophomonas sp. B1-1]|uniref:hypothetical protein n=1 Tax=Stenotrophomonas sp. B1-1 TaxID=2710648 RepID=UPI0013DCE773|nr:hypothetical protein [Stenotrophomonas sp. B1-1]